jgi:hypothetical protein
MLIEDVDLAVEGAKGPSLGCGEPDVVDLRRVRAGVAFEVPLLGAAFLQESRRSFSQLELGATWPIER